MTKTARKFIDPATRKPLDREWLDHELEIFITSKPVAIRSGRYGTDRSEREIYGHFAPTSGGWKFSDIRPSWQKKPRKVRRQMLAASLRRLISIGKIRVSYTDHPNRRSMNGMVRKSRESDMRMFGQDHDGIIRFFVAGSILDALVEALGDIE